MTGDKQEQKKAPTITELIDGDEGLKSKRKLLTITSLILLAIVFSGARIEEANTFLFRITFENSERLTGLLFLSVLMLMLRYRNYAHRYKKQLYQLWVSRMLSNPFFQVRDDQDTSISGYLMDYMPEKLKENFSDFPNVSNLSFDYRCRFLFRPEIIYSHYCGGPDPEEYVLKVKEHKWIIIWLDLKARFGQLINHRESLDILTPSLIGYTAIVFFIAVHGERLAMSIFGS
jgi:hypothetical protein